MGFDAEIVRETKPPPAHDLGRRRQAVEVVRTHAVDCDMDEDCTCEEGRR